MLHKTKKFKMSAREIHALCYEVLIIDRATNNLIKRYEIALSLGQYHGDVFKIALKWHKLGFKGGF